MKWPLVSRSKYETTFRRMVGYVNALTRENDDLRKVSLAAHQQLSELQFRYEQLDRREKNERLRRLRAEGLAAFKDDRIRGALALLYREESGVKKTG